MISVLRCLRRNQLLQASPTIAQNSYWSSGGGEVGGSGNCGSRFNSNSTAAAEEIDKFQRLASSWWDTNGAFKPLHSMNSLRVQFIRDGLINNGQIQSANCPTPLEGVKLLDVGCGGGILTEPLARLGGELTGIDAGEEGILVAQSHLPQHLRHKVSYECSTIEAFAEANPGVLFDGVVVSEVIEHVDQPKVFLQIASQLLKPMGSLFVTTISRTTNSWLGAILAAEHLLRIVPTGTHSWNKFLTPEEIQSIVHTNGCQIKLVHGMAYNPWKNVWSWTPNTSINYAIHAVKTDIL